MMGETPMPGMPSAFERDYARGDLPVAINTPTKGCIYAFVQLVMSWAIPILVVVLIVLGIRACIA